MTRIANRDAGRYVDRKEFFKGSNLFGFWSWNNTTRPDVTRTEPDPVPGDQGAGLYIVTSYGNHYPALVFDPAAEKWFHNADGYSSSTARHQRYIGRRGDPLTTEALQDLIRAGGVVNAVSQRMEDTYA